MKGRCSLRPKSVSPSPTVTLLKDKKQGRTLLVREKRGFPSSVRGSADTCEEGGILPLCRRRWERMRGVEALGMCRGP